MKRIIIAGASGFIGKNLCTALVKEGYEVITVTRGKEKTRNLNYKRINWSQTKTLKKEIEGSFAVINLAGAPLIGKRWSAAYKKTILESRISTTQTLVELIKDVEKKPKVFINGSAVGYYGEKTTYICDEEKNPGKDFLAEVCRRWEEEAKSAEKENIRVVLIRSAIVLDKHEGALSKMLPPFQFFLGGPIGSGSQFFPWIHVQDEVGIIIFALAHEKVTGPINAVAPEIITNKKFTKTLGEVLHRPSFFPVPELVLKIIFGEASSTLTTGTQVSSRKIESLGYTFKFPTINSALKDILTASSQK